MGKKIPNVPWDQIQKDYQSGKGSCRELAIKYGLKPNTVSTRCAKRGWAKKANEIAKKVEEEVVQDLASTIKLLLKKKFPPDMWTGQLSRVAGFDLAEIFEVDDVTGETKLKKNWTKKANGGVLAGVKVKCLTTEEGLVVQQVEVKPHDSMEAHRRIGEILGYETAKGAAAPQVAVQINVAELCDKLPKVLPEEKAEGK